MKLLLSVALFFFCMSVPVEGQNQHVRLESLRQKITTANPDQYPLFFELINDECFSLTPLEAMVEAQRTMSWADSLQNPDILVYALGNLGQVYADHGRDSDAMLYYSEAYEKAKLNASQREMAFVSLRLANFYFGRDLLPDAIEKGYEAIRVFELLHDTLSLFKAHYFNSQINFRARSFKDAMEEAQEALKDFEHMKNLLRKDSSDVMNCYNTIGLCCFKLEKYDQAIAAYHQAEVFAIAMNNRFWSSLIHGNRANVYRTQGFLDLAMHDLQIDFIISKEFKEWQSAGRAGALLADLLIDMKKNIQAKQYLDSVRTLLPRINKSAVNAEYYRVLAKYLESTGQYREATRILRHQMVAQDSVARENEEASTSRFRVRYELEKKQAEISQLMNANDLQKERINNQLMIIGASFIIFLLVAILVFVLVTDRKRLKAQYLLVALQRNEIENKNHELEAQGQKLQEQNLTIQSSNAQLEEKVKTRTLELETINRELDTFLYHASHDIRRPIATLLGLDQVARLTTIEPGIAMLFDRVAETARSMDNMLYKLQMVYELNRPLEGNRMVNLHQILNEVAARFDADFHRHGIDYIQVQGAPIQFLSDPVLLKIIFQNLMENAIQFGAPFPTEKHFVRVTAYQLQDGISILVEDNGAGIDEKYHDKVFQLFFRGTEQSKGNGIGLYLVRKAVTMLHGTITLESEFGKGARFSVFLPILQPHQH
jgi:signal transduction histidine kinase